MSARPPSTEKICRACGVDCSGRPRVKDRKGRYYCRDCYEQAKKDLAAKQARAATPPPPPPDYADSDSQIGSSSEHVFADSGEVKCQSCGASLPEGAILCTACGFNLTTGERLAGVDEAPPVIRPLAGAPSAGVDAGVGPRKERKTKAKRRTSDEGGGIGEQLKRPFMFFVVPTIFFGVFVALAWSDEDIALWFTLVQSAFGFGIGVWTLVKAFQEGATTGLLCLCVPFYAIYFIYFVNDDPHLKALFGVSLWTTAAGYAIELAAPPDAF